MEVVEAGKAAVKGRAGLVSCWRQFPDKLLVGVVLGAWVALFHFWGNSTLGYVNSPSLFGWWFWMSTRGVEGGNAWQVLQQLLALDEVHLWFMPFVVLGLFWWKRRELAELPKGQWWPAMVALALALLLHVLGYLAQQTRISLVAFCVGLYALTGLFWGREWMRDSLFPFSLLLFCVPLGPNNIEFITFPLRLLATKITMLFVNGILGIDAIQSGTAIWDSSGRYQFEVAAACGGIRSLIAIIALAVVFGHVDFSRNWLRLVLVAAAVPLAVIGNVARLCAIIMAAEAFGQSAGNYVHGNFWLSLLPYIPAFACFALLGRWLGKRGAKAGLILKAKVV